MHKFFRQYFNDYNHTLARFLKDRRNADNLLKAIDLIKNARNAGSTIYLIGNGGSSAIAEHMAVDLTKNAGLRAMTLSGSPMLTTFSNDYGYERVFEKFIKHFGRKGDILIAISSSGASKNILNARKAARSKKMQIITFSGFNPNNRLRKIGDLNFWVDSKSFGYVELIHGLLIHYINDAVIGSAVYKK